MGFGARITLRSRIKTHRIISQGVGAALSSQFGELFVRELTLQKFFQVLGQLRNVELAFFPGYIRATECCIIRRTILANAFWNYFLPWK
jgi:hypothetical protein